MTSRFEVRIVKGNTEAKREDKDVEGGVRDVASAPSQEPMIFEPEDAAPDEVEDN